MCKNQKYRGFEHNTKTMAEIWRKYESVNWAIIGSDNGLFGAK